MDKYRGFLLLALGASLVVYMGACAGPLPSVAGWYAVQPEIDMTLEHRRGPDGAPVLSLLYTVVPGRSYAIEHAMPAGMGHGQPDVILLARATRVLHLAVVLRDAAGDEHEAVRTLTAGEWRELAYDAFCPPLEDGAMVQVLRIEDRTGALGGQGPVSLKLAGLPLVQ